MKLTERRVSVCARQAGFWTKGICDAFVCDWLEMVAKIEEARQHVASQIACQVDAERRIEELEAESAALRKVAEAALKMIDGHLALREAGLLARPTEAAEQLIDMVKRELEGCLNDGRAESKK